MFDERNVPNILIVDKDRTFGQILVDYLGRNDLSARQVTTRKDALECQEKGEPDLIILDPQLRNEDGLDVLKTLRRATDIPVIIVTEDKLDEVDRVVGLELGADDYLAKPLGLRELLARIRAILRRQAHALAPRRSDRGKFRFGGWELRLKTRELKDPRGQPVPLTKGEYALLIAFLEAAGRPLSREYLLQATRIHEDIFDRSIDVQILRLRRKLVDDASRPQLILTERGVGYTFALPVLRS
ncbi:MAG: response regulator [Rhizobium sp.]|nr:MAG: response regulator [Rhizobium sp.]